MKTATYYLSFVLMLFSSFSVAAKENINIITAQETGTYYQIAKDIQKIAPPNIKVNVAPSVGSLTNALLIATNPNYQLGMLQLNIFNSLLQEGKFVDSIRLALPLYNEELHLVANDRIEKLSDLKGKKVAVDIQGTGTFSVAEALLEQAGLLNEVEQVFLGGQNAVDALKNLEIDAMFYVVGYPAPLFNSLFKEETKKGNNTFHLVPITLSSLDESFHSTVIPKGTYHGQPEDIETLSVPVFLIMHHFEKTDENCAHVSELIKTIYNKLDWLKENGHSKWKDVTIDLEKLKQNKSLSPCAQAALELDSN